MEVGFLVSKLHSYLKIEVESFVVIAFFLSNRGSLVYIIRLHFNARPFSYVG